MTASRVGRKPVVTKGVDIKVDNQQVTIKGPKGQTHLQLNSLVELQMADGVLTVKESGKNQYSRSGTESKLKSSIIGTIRSRIANLIEGVTKGYERPLALVGVGYKAQVKGKVLNLSIGYSHPVNFDFPEGITIETPTPTEIIIKGTDKHLVGQVAAKIRAFRPPEPYKGKGIRYKDERIILKETKKK